MDPKRPSPPLPHGMNVTVLSTASRGGFILGIGTAELSRILGCDPDDHITMSDWASINDAHFYAQNEKQFSYEAAIAETVAIGLPRVVLYKIPKDKGKKVAQPVTAQPTVEVEVDKKKTTRKKKSPAS